MTAAKIPTRREIRATMLDAMATTLHYDRGEAGYLYEPWEDKLSNADMAKYRDRASKVGDELVNEFLRRAEKLRRTA